MGDAEDGTERALLAPGQQEARSLAAVLGPRATVRDLSEGRAVVEVAVAHAGRMEVHLYLFSATNPEQWAGHWEQAVRMYLRPGGEA